MSVSLIKSTDSVTRAVQLSDLRVKANQALGKLLAYKHCNGDYSRNINAWANELRSLIIQIERF